MKKLKSLILNRRGQNTVEYLLMLSVVVGVVLVTGVALKKYMPNIMNDIMSKITATADTMGNAN